MKRTIPIEEQPLTWKEIAISIIVTLAMMVDWATFFLG